MNEDRNLDNTLNEDSVPDTTAANDPLAVAGGDVDTSYPCLPGGLYRMTIAKAERVAAKATTDLDDDDPEKCWNAKLTLKTTTVTYSTEGEDLQPGFVVSAYIALDPRGEDYPMSKVKKGIAQVLQAVYGVKTTQPLSLLRDNPESLVDKVVDVKLKISKPTEEFPNPSNNVASWIPLKN